MTTLGDFTATSIDGHETHLSAYEGQVVLLNIWATWCAPCRELRHDAAEDAVDVLRQDDERAQRRPVAVAVEHGGGRLVARGLDAEHAHGRYAVTGCAPAAASAAAAGGAGKACPA